jgi:hypothetical protein
MSVDALWYVRNTNLFAYSCHASWKHGISHTRKSTHTYNPNPFMWHKQNGFCFKVFQNFEFQNYDYFNLKTLVDPPVNVPQYILYFILYNIDQEIIIATKIKWERDQFVWWFKLFIFKINSPGNAAIYY